MDRNERKRGKKREICPNMPKTTQTDAVIATNMLPSHRRDKTLKKTQQKKVLSVLLTFFEIGV